MGLKENAKAIIITNKNICLDCGRLKLLCEQINRFQGYLGIHGCRDSQNVQIASKEVKDGI